MKEAKELLQSANNIPQSVEELIENAVIFAKTSPIYFWGHRPSKDGSISKACLSQWWQCNFTVDGIPYQSAEQYMMAEKARLFGDENCRKSILVSRDPKEAKALGRKANGFNDELWCRERLQIVNKGNTAKFSQNDHLHRFLLQTGEALLVEASPVDPIWGVGLAEDDPNIKNPKTWKGLNLLGFALMKVRETIQIE